MDESSTLRSLFEAYSAHWQPLRIEPVQNAGFSGGAVWKVQTPSAPVALRLWKPGYPAERVSILHKIQRLSREAGCDFVPEPIENSHGRTWLEKEGHLWELCTWMPGEACLDSPPDEDQLRSALVALARWHRSLRPADLGHESEILSDRETAAAFLSEQKSPSPGMARRRSEWLRLQRLCGKIPKNSFDDPCGLVTRTRNLVRRHDEAMRSWLRKADESVPIRICLRDVHREHVLFTGREVTGLIDFGACGLDTPACDLGRLLGDYLPDDPGRWKMAIEWYREVAPLSQAEAELAPKFDRTGTMVGALHWLEWLAIGARRFSDPEGAYARWQTLVERMERWNLEEG